MAVVGLRNHKLHGDDADGSLPALSFIATVRMFEPTEAASEQFWNPKLGGQVPDTVIATPAQVTLVTVPVPPPTLHPNVCVEVE